eukprot:CAMPEP_0176185588 /NCGR_PEP_ID=MMETSP0121_2-20121125/1432_1 /TAXON_ID=160619 /ORGANISM="Kryptoperidinium foliaceum, Strain CCMP 1326" /LENGTH=234 /DNA_ID=CAMNT_0017524047 /DNA_START=246 /DNA_END=947 /DNA_ORIENTATION=-
MDLDENRCLGDMTDTDHHRREFASHRGPADNVAGEHVRRRRPHGAAPHRNPTQSSGAPARAPHPESGEERGRARAPALTSTGAAARPVAVDAHHLEHVRLVVDLAIVVHLRVQDHLVDLVLGQLLAHVGHRMPPMCQADLPSLLGVEDLEHLDELPLRGHPRPLLHHQGEELLEVHRALALQVEAVDHLLQLGLRRVLAQRAHQRAELVRADPPVLVAVEVLEPLRELGDQLLA